MKWMCISLLWLSLAGMHVQALDPAMTPEMHIAIREKQRANHEAEQLKLKQAVEQQRQDVLAVLGHPPEQVVEVCTQREPRKPVRPVLFSQTIWLLLLACGFGVFWLIDRFVLRKEKHTKEYSA